jgi:hypothetical protein
MKAEMSPQSLTRSWVETNVPTSLLSSQSPLTSIYNNAQSLLMAPSLANNNTNSALPAGALGGAGVVSAAVALLKIFNLLLTARSLV